MFEYLFVFCVSILLANRVQAVKSRPNSAITIRLLLFLLIALLTCFIGLRYRIGTDYNAYYQGYYLFSRLEWRDFLDIGDPGLRLLAKLCSYVWDDPVMMFLVAACIFFTLYVVSIYKYSSNFFAAIAMFIVSGTMLDSCNGVRQSLAMAILFSGYGFLRDRKFLKYAMLVLLATAFHSTAIIMLPVYFLLSRKTTWWRILIILIASVALTYSYDYIFDLVETVTEKDVNLEYTYYVQSVNIFRVAVAVAPCVLIPMIRKDSFEKCSISINIVVFNAALMCITANSAFLARIGMYSTGFLCLALPDILEHLRIRNSFFVKTAVYVCYFLYWIASIYLTANLYPYQSIFSR